jgi:hypothetical protein
MHYCYVMSDEERGYLWMTVSAALGCDADRRALRANFGRDAVSFERLRTFCRDLKLTDKERQLGVQKLVDAVAGALGEVDDSCPLDDFIDAVAKRLRAAEPKEEAKKQ